MGDLPMGDLPVVLVWPMLTSALLGWAAPRLARALPPALAVRLLAAGAVICAASTTLVLALTAWLLLAEIPVVAALGHWSAPQVDLRQPVPDIVEALAGAGGHDRPGERCDGLLHPQHAGRAAGPSVLTTGPHESTHRPPRGLCHW
jgi:hypothetical protein